MQDNAAGAFSWDSTRNFKPIVPSECGKSHSDSVTSHNKCTRPSISINEGN